MPKISIDFEKVPDFRVIPDGTYIGRVVSCDEKETSSGLGKHTMKVDLEKPADIAKDVGSVFIDFPKAEGALFRLKGFLRAIGCLHPDGWDPEEVIGKQVGFVANIEVTQEWGVRNRWVRFVKAAGAKAKANRPQTEVDGLVEKHELGGGLKVEESTDKSVNAKSLFG